VSPTIAYRRGGVFTADGHSNYRLAVMRGLQSASVKDGCWRRCRTAGAAALIIGTAVSGIEWLAVPVTIPIAFGIFFAGVAGPV